MLVFKLKRSKAYISRRTRIYRVHVPDNVPLAPVKSFFFPSCRVFVTDSTRYRRCRWVYGALGAGNGIRLFPTLG